MSTVGLYEQMVREYIRAQEERDRYFYQMNLSLLAAHICPFERGARLSNRLLRRPVLT